MCALLDSSLKLCGGSALSTQDDGGIAMIEYIHTPTPEPSVASPSNNLLAFLTLLSFCRLQRKGGEREG